MSICLLIPCPMNNTALRIMFAVKVKVLLIVESVVLCVVMTPVLNTMFDGLRHYTIIHDMMQCVESTFFFLNSVFKT